MAKKKITDHDYDDGLHYLNPLVEIDVPSELPTTPGIGSDDSTLIPAQSQHSTGRGCPECSGDLVLFEYVKADDLVLLRCKHCKKIWHEPDLKSDALYRLIPLSVVHQYANKIDRQAVIYARENGIPNPNG